MSHRGPVDKGRGWIYILVDKLLRVVYIGSTQGYIPARALYHAKRSGLTRAKYSGSYEALRGYNGFGVGRRHVLIEMEKVVGDTQALEHREGLVQATGFWMALQNRKYRCWENDPAAGFNVNGLESFRLRLRRVVQVQHHVKQCSHLSCVVHCACIICLYVCCAERHRV